VNDELSLLPENRPSVIPRRAEAEGLSVVVEKVGSIRPTGRIPRYADPLHSIFYLLAVNDTLGSQRVRQGAMRENSPLPGMLGSRFCGSLGKQELHFSRGNERTSGSRKRSQKSPADCSESFASQSSWI
jgi:hypothetical protein